MMDASLPHARGGVSVIDSQALTVGRSSPRPWGCFWDLRDGSKPIRVFPTPVGVFLTCICQPGQMAGLPHARGGVSR